MQSIELLTTKDLESLRESLLAEIRRLLGPEKEKQKNWLKSREVRKILKVSAGSLQNLRISGKLNPKKIGGTYYYSADEVNSLFQ
jgi:hypothetical protein